MNMEYTDILFGFAVLVGMFGGQVAIVKRSTSFVKELTGISGNFVRLVSFIMGAVFGSLFLWVWVVMNPGLHISVYVLNSVLFLITAGLTASGDYDLNNESNE